VFIRAWAKGSRRRLPPIRRMRATRIDNRPGFPWIRRAGVGVGGLPTRGACLFKSVALGHICNVMSPFRFLRVAAGCLGVALVAFVGAPAAGCAHQVTVQSNVPEARVRVDGVDIGTVGPVDGAASPAPNPVPSAPAAAVGAVFAERGGFGAVYDIEVSAPGYRTERRVLSPSETDPCLGIPAMGMVVCSCAAASCLAPLAGLGYLVSAPSETDVQLGAAIVGASSIALVAGSAAIAAWGVERMPDVVTIDLDVDDGSTPVGSTMPY
jgi:hypothetical protein